MHRARLLVFLTALVAPLWAKAHVASLRDTLVVDGVTVYVDAQVRFDSIRTNPRNSTSAFQAAWTANGLMGLGVPPTGWKHWTGNPDLNLQFSAELVRLPSRLDRRKRFQWQARLDAGFMITSLVSIDGSTFPDSLIGFLSATAAAPLRMVTSQQFDIGTETDTLDATTGRTAATVPFASVGFDGVLGECYAGIAVGVGYRMQSSQDRPTLNSPSLEGAAFVPGKQRGQGIDPMIQGRIGYRKSSSSWAFQLTGLWMPQSVQKHWWGVGVKYDAW